MNVSFVGTNDAHIYLSSGGYPNRRTNGYEIVIGGWSNKRSVIRAMDPQNRRRAGREVASINGKMVGGGAKSFQILKERTTIKVTREGETRPILMFNRASLAIKEVYLMTGWGSTGKWNFEIGTTQPPVPTTSTTLPPTTQPPTPTTQPPTPTFNANCWSVTPTTSVSDQNWGIHMNGNADGNSLQLGFFDYGYFVRLTGQSPRQLRPYYTCNTCRWGRGHQYNGVNVAVVFGYRIVGDEFWLGKGCGSTFQALYKAKFSGSIRDVHKLQADRGYRVQMSAQELGWATPSTQAPTTIPPTTQAPTILPTTQPPTPTTSTTTDMDIVIPVEVNASKVDHFDIKVQLTK